MILHRAEADSTESNDQRVSEQKTNLFDFTASESRFDEVSSNLRVSEQKTNLFDFTIVGVGFARPLYIDPAVPYAEMPSRQRKHHLFKLVHIVFAISFNDRHCSLFKVTFAGNIHTLKSTNFTMATVGTGSACP